MAVIASVRRPPRASSGSVPSPGAARSSTLGRTVSAVRSLVLLEIGRDDESVDVAFGSVVVPRPRAEHDDLRDLDSRPLGTRSNRPPLLVRYIVDRFPIHWSKSSAFATDRSGFGTSMLPASGYPATVLAQLRSSSAVRNRLERLRSQYSTLLLPVFSLRYRGVVLSGVASERRTPPRRPEVRPRSSDRPTRPRHRAG